MMKSGKEFSRHGRLCVRVSVAVMAVALASCSNIEHKIGSTVKGERVAVMENKRTIEVDTGLKGSKFVVPATKVVKDWPMAGYDASHMMPNAAIDAHPKEAWSADIGDGSSSDLKLIAKPVVGNGMVFTMDSEGKVSGFDAKSGERKWKFDTTPEEADDKAMGGGVGFANNVVFATTGFGEVIALNAADGSVKWRRKLMNPIHSAPTIANGHVYAIAIDNELQALDINTGTVVWHHRGIVESAALMGASSPAATDHGVIVAYSSGEIFNLRPENGRASWNYILSAPTQVGALPAIADIRGLPVVDQDKVYAISHSGRFAAVDLRTGDRSWEADIGGINTPLVVGDVVYALSSDMQLVALTRDSGRVIWVDQLERHEDPSDRESDPVFWTGPIVAADRLWLVNSLGKLTAYSPIDGKQLYDIELSGPVFIPPVVAGNTMYIVLDSGRLVALR